MLEVCGVQQAAASLLVHSVAGAAHTTLSCCAAAYLYDFTAVTGNSW